jgi:hypothetical protein
MVYYILSETGAFILPAHVACGKCIVQKEEQVLNAVRDVPSTITCWVVYETRLSHRVQFGVHSMRSSSILIVCILFKDCSQEIVIFAPSFGGGFYIKLDKPLCVHEWTLENHDATLCLNRG